MPQMTGTEKITERAYARDVWAEKINGKQLEFNAAVVVNAEIMKEETFKVLANPAFEESTSKEAMAPMTVYAAKEGDSLWGIAKKFKTSAETVSRLNQLEGEQISEGRKLLIIR